MHPGESVEAVLSENSLKCKIVTDRVRVGSGSATEVKYSVQIT